MTKSLLVFHFICCLSYNIVKFIISEQYVQQKNPQIDVWCHSFSWISDRNTTSLGLSDKICFFMRMSVLCYGIKWISDKITTSLGIQNKCYCFMRRSVRCYGLKWISDKITCFFIKSFITVVVSWLSYDRVNKK